MPEGLNRRFGVITRNPATVENKMYVEDEEEVFAGIVDSTPVTFGSDRRSGRVNEGHVVLGFMQRKYYQDKIDSIQRRIDEKYL